MFSQIESKQYYSIPFNIPSHLSFHLNKDYLKQQNQETEGTRIFFERNFMLVNPMNEQVSSRIIELETWSSTIHIACAYNKFKGAKARFLSWIAEKEQRTCKFGKCPKWRGSVPSQNSLLSTESKAISHSTPFARTYN